MHFVIAQAQESEAHNASQTLNSEKRVSTTLKQLLYAKWVFGALTSTSVGLWNHL